MPRAKQVECPQCGKVVSSRYLKRHSERYCAYNEMGDLTDEQRLRDAEWMNRFPPEHIATECLAIQKSWDENEKAKRYANDRLKRIRWICPGTEHERTPTHKEKQDDKRGRKSQRKRRKAK